MSHAHSFRTTLSIKTSPTLTVGDNWFRVVDLDFDPETPEKKCVLVATQHPTIRFASKGRLVAEGQRVEIFPKTFVTFTKLAKPSKIKVQVVVDSGIVISKGYPYQRNTK